MAEAPIQYKRLPGTGVRREGNAVITTRRMVSRLWLGPDHLLCAERSWCVETYKRFDYRDIQALIVRRTNKASVTTGVLATLALLGILFALMTGEYGRWIWGTVGATFAIFCIINAARGGSCVTHLKTAVQLEELPAWARLPNARRGIALLRERALEAQGNLPEGELVSRFETLLSEQTTPGAAMAQAQADARNSETALKPYRGRVHAVLFWLLLVEGLVILWRIPFNSVGAVVVNAIVTTATFGTGVFALLRQHETDLAATLKKLTWAAAAVGAAQLVAGYFYIITFSLRHPTYAYDQWLLWKSMGETNVMEKAGDIILLLVLGGAKVCLGFAGLLRNRRPPASPVPPVPPEPPSPAVPPII